MNKYLTRRYYVDENGNLDKLGKSINCYEQVLYQALRDYQVNYKFAFCEDINLIYKSNENTNYFGLNRLNLNNNLFNINRKKYINLVESINYIKNNIDTSKFVAVRTMFDMLPPYVWYDESSEGKRNTHFLLVVGYDDNSYYFTDSPTILIKERFSPLNGNNTVGIINKKVFEKALEKCCEALVIDVNLKYIDDIDKLNIILNNIVNEYYFEDKANGIVCGKSIFKLILNPNYNNNFEKALRVFFCDSFEIYLVAKRREILLDCLKDNQNQYNQNDFYKVENYLIKSSEMWNILSNLISKYELKKRGIPFDEIRKYIKSIADVEDKLIMSIDKMLKSSKVRLNPL